MTTTPADRNVEVNGLNIHYLDWGGDSNRNLLLVHGQGGNAHNWDHIARALSGEFRVIAVDQRGHGDSDHTREGYGADRFAADLAEFVEKIGHRALRLRWRLARRAQRHRLRRRPLGSPQALRLPRLRT